MSLDWSEPVAPRRAPLGAAVSVGLHLGLLLAVLLATTARPLPTAPPQSIEVDLVPATPAVAAQPLPAPIAAPTATETVLATGQPAGRAGSLQEPKDGMIHTRPNFATAFLKDPANAKVRKTLSTFAPDERLVQLCNMEGLEQIRRAYPKFDPDVLVSYAMADTSVEGLTLTATGGAFHSGRNWYAIRLSCTIAPDYSGVTGFDFAVGAPIPKSLWASHNLPEQYEDSE